jgi:hypothetical protein
MRRLSIKLVVLTVLALAAGAAPAGAATIGQTSTPAVFCSPFDRVQPTVTSGNSYVVPSTDGITNWTLTSWSTQGGTAAGDALTMKVYRSLGPTSFQVIVHDGPHTITPSTLNTFQANLAVKAGDILGNSTGPADTTGPICTFNVTGETYLRRAGSLDDGGNGTFDLFAGDRRLNVSATVEPTNTFTVDGVTRNKKNGTATATITVPNPGTATVGGNGVKASSSGARAAASIPSAGTVQLPISASGKKKKKLKRKGKVSVSPTITYTPTGGKAQAIATSVTLKRKK